VPCLTGLADSRILDKAKQTLEQIFWELHNNKVSALGKEAASIWSYSKEEADLREKLVEDAKIGDC
jgi:hypothetical protein